MHAKRDRAVPPAEPGSARYFACLYADEASREPLRLLLAIEREIATALRPGLDHHIAHLRLEWWREECARFPRGTPAHPTMRRLRELTGDSAARLELQGLVDAASWDLAAAPCDTRAELDAYGERWARGLIVPFAFADHGAPPDEGIERSVRAAGKALREMEQLRALAPDARLGRLRLPLDELDMLGIEPRTLAMPPWPAPLAAHLRARFTTTRGACIDAWRTLDARTQARLSGLAAWCAVESASSARAARMLPHAWREHRTHGLSNAWRAWRAARTAHRGRARIS